MNKAFSITVILAFVFSWPGGFRQATNDTRPKVVKAVSPIFIPWVVGRTAEAEVIVEVRINSAGDVSSATIVEATPYFPRDVSFVNTAKQWKFEPSDAGSRSARLTFIFSILPKGTPLRNLTSIYTAPYTFEVRHEVFDIYTHEDPNPVRPSQGLKKKKFNKKNE
jgi:TonB family protein